MDALRQSVKSVLDPVYDNQYSYAILIIFLSLYAGYTAPLLPEVVAHLFQRTAFKLLIIFLVCFSTVGTFVPSLVVTLLAYFIFPIFENSSLLYHSEEAGYNLVSSITGNNDDSDDDDDN